MQSYSPFDNSRFTAKTTVEIMRGTLWCQCFCLLMRRELSFLSVCNFLVCPWPWQLAYVKPINPQRSLRCRASGLCTHYAPSQLLDPSFLLARSPRSFHICHSPEDLGDVCFIFFFPILSLFVLPSFSSWIPNREPSFSTSPCLLLHQYLGLFSFPRVRVRRRLL